MNEYPSDVISRGRIVLPHGQPQDQFQVYAEPIQNLTYNSATSSLASKDGLRTDESTLEESQLLASGDDAEFLRTISAFAPSGSVIFGPSSQHFSDVLFLLWRRQRLQKEVDSLVQRSKDAHDPASINRYMAEYDALSPRLHQTLMAYDESVKLFGEVGQVGDIKDPRSVLFSSFAKEARLWQSAEDVTQSLNTLYTKIDKQARFINNEIGPIGRALLYRLDWLLYLVLKFTPEGSTPEAQVLTSSESYSPLLLLPIKYEVLRRIRGRLLLAVFASAILLVPVIILFFIPSTGYRILALCCFAMLFGILMGLSQASPSDTLTGIAAFVALLIVFVGTTGGDS